MAKPAFNLKATRSRALREHVYPAAQYGRDTAIDLHLTSPRGGRNVNAFGQQRSAPGEPPAKEFGQLERALKTPIMLEGNGAAFIVNNRHLEDGTVHIAPRPNGLKTLNKMRQRAKSGRGWP